MNWTPVTIRSTLDDDYTASGVYIFDALRKTELCVSLSSPLLSLINSRKNRALCALQTSLEEVIWEDVVLLKEVPLQEVAQELKAVGREFSLLPEPGVHLLVFQFLSSKGLSERSQLATSPLRAVPPTIADLVKITSSPFAGRHTALFHGYISTGIVSLIRKSIVFVDARYLDGMEGGNVQHYSPRKSLTDDRSNEQESIGLVLGAIVKSRGQGKLVAVVPWSEISPHLYDVPGTYSKELTMPVWSGVVALQINVADHSLSWGSGVLVAPDLVITNNHVIKEQPLDTIEVWINRSSEVSVLRRATLVSQPLEGLDLVVVKLNLPVPSEYPPAVLAELDPVIMTRVRSVGFGLFTPLRSGKCLFPLESTGIVSKVVTGMLILSAACWNGSSGGGVFNDAGELVGLLASNAKDSRSGEIMPDLSMSIPVSVIRLALDNFTQNSTQRTSQQFQMLWNLEKTYEDIRASLTSKL